MADYGYDDDVRSRYDEPPRRYKTTRTRPRRANEPEYVEEETFIERGKGRPPQELVFRGRDRDDSVEDIQRDFSPPGGRRPRGYDDYGAPRRRARSQASRRYNDDSDDDFGPAAAGAAAGAAGGYAAGRRGYKDDRRRRRDSYYSDDDRSPPPRRKPERKKSGIEGALEGIGLGGLAATLTGNKDKDRDSSRSRSRSRPRGDKKQREWAQAAQAALIAGAVEAFRSRGEPGPWTGDKGKRIATAAIGAGGIDKVLDRDPDNKSKKHLVEAVLGGLAANRLANGPPRSASRGSGGGSRSRSRARSGSVWSRYRSKSRGRGRRGSSASSAEEKPSTQEKIKDLAAGGVLAGVGKQLYDRFRSKSRGPNNRRGSSSEGSADSYRSRSRRRDRDVGPYSQSRGGPDDGAVVGPRGRGGGAGAGAGALAAQGGSRGQEGSEDDDSESSTDLENKRKKMRGKEYLTAALASIATIHAAHGVYQSMEASDKRHKLVAEGEMTPEEARKKRSKAWLQDAAAVGIAALGIKGAYSEWKEMNEQRHTIKELEDRRRQRQKRQQRRMKQGGGANGGPYMSGASGGGGGGGGRYDDRYYNDGNPYANGGPPNGYGR